MAPLSPPSADGKLGTVSRAFIINYANAMAALVSSSCTRTDKNCSIVVSSVTLTVRL